MSSLLLPAIEHQLIDSLRAIHRCWKPVSFLDRLYHVLIGPVPVRPLAVRHHLPTNDPHAPHVGSAGEFSECYRFRGRPSHRDLSTLFAGVNSLDQDPIFQTCESRVSRREAKNDARASSEAKNDARASSEAMGGQVVGGTER